MRKNLFLTYVAIILFLSGIIGYYSIKISREYYTENYKENLVKEGKILSSIIKDSYLEKGEEAFRSFAKKYSDELELRITIISDNGEVLEDSWTDPDMLENHKNRAEVTEALNGNIGIEQRYSNSTKNEYIYVAVPITSNEDNFILRLGVPLVALNSIKSEMVVYIIMCVIIAALGAFIFAYYYSARITEPLNQLTDAADEISKGNYGKKIYIDDNDQISRLTRAFNQMGNVLSATVDKLENENIKLEAIVNSMINAVIAVDNESKILMINSVSYKLFGIKINNIIGYNFYDILRDENITKVLETSVNEKRHVVDEIVYNTLYEGSRILRVYANPIPSQNPGQSDYLGSLLVFQDVTQIRKLEQLRSDFVSNVTHELKTPLTSIMGFTDTLKSGAINDPIAAMHFIDIIDIETQRLYRLILDILSLSEIETRKEDINVNYEHMEEIINCVCDMLQPQAEAKSLYIKADIEKNLQPFNCNRDRISQMLINLIENAVKYTEKGGVNISCKRVNSYIEIVVSDTGIGIPEDSVSRVFERFYRVDKGRSRKVGGTGLGLSIVKHIVMLYEGQMSVDSIEGVGTSFIIKLPVEL